MCRVRSLCLMPTRSESQHSVAFNTMDANLLKHRWKYFDWKRLLCSHLLITEWSFESMSIPNYLLVINKGLDRSVVVVAPDQNRSHPHTRSPHYILSSTNYSQAPFTSMTKIRDMTTSSLCSLFKLSLFPSYLTDYGLKNMIASNQMRARCCALLDQL